MSLPCCSMNTFNCVVSVQKLRNQQLFKWFIIKYGFVRNLWQLALLSVGWLVWRVPAPSCRVVSEFVLFQESCLLSCFCVKGERNYATFALLLMHNPFSNRRASRILLWALFLQILSTANSCCRVLSHLFSRIRLSALFTCLDGFCVVQKFCRMGLSGVHHRVPASHGLHGFDVSGPVPCKRWENGAFNGDDESVNYRCRKASCGCWGRAHD